VLRVGLTGGVASGKSTVARLLEEHGAAVQDADALVEGLYRRGGAAVDAVVERFGEEVRGADGGVDRRHLAGLVLGDRDARRRLEEVVHPLVRVEVRSWFERLAGREAPPVVAVVEAALLVETGTWHAYHRLVVVEAELSHRRSRALEAGWEADAFARMVAAQTGDASRRAAASYLIRNDGSPEQLAQAVARLWTELLEDARALHAGRPLPTREVSPG
jgi:dephospho-CoA kinase